MCDQDETLQEELRVLRNELRVNKACDIYALAEAYRNIDKCGQDRYMASAVTIIIKNINTKASNNVVIEEVAITDGLSPATIAAIKADIKRSYDLIMAYPHNKI